MTTPTKLNQNKRSSTGSVATTVTSTNSFALTNAVTAGSLLVALVTYRYASAVAAALTSVQDSINGTWTKVTNSTVTNTFTGEKQEVWYFANAAAGSTTVAAIFDVTNTGNALNFEVWEFDSIQTSSPSDGNAATATGNSGTASVSLPINTANALVVAIANFDGSGPSVTAGAAYTKGDELDAFWYSAAIYDLDAGAAGTVTVDATAGSGHWSITAAAFKIVSAAVQVPFTRSQQLQPILAS